MSSTNSPENTPAGQLRSFALIFAGFFAIVALWPLVMRGEQPRVWALVVMGVCVVWGFLHPKSLQKPYDVWMKFGGVLGRINAKIILSVVFFVLVTPIRMVMALFRYDPMKRRLERDAESYKVERQPRPASHMRRQF